MKRATGSLTSVDVSARDTNQASGLGWALWSVAAALPWLVPTHSEPWTTFYSELLMAAVLIPVALWAVAVAPAKWRVEWLVVGIAIAACIPLFQAWGGYFTFPDEALLIGLFLSGFGLTILIAQQADTAAPLRLVEGLFASLAMAALLSTGMALAQWLQLDALGFLVARTTESRPVANVGQPNNLSTLLVWGLLAIWWGYSRQRLGGRVATLAAGFLLIGIALTQSRTGLVAVCALAIAALFGRKLVPLTLRMSVLVGLTLWFALLVIGLEPASQLILNSATRTLGEQTTAGTRPMVWSMALEAIQQRPWLGYGWNQSVQAYVALSGRFPDLHETIQFAHNVVLDLLLWNGLPLGLLLVSGLALWFWHQLRGPQTPERRLLLLALGVFGLHAMLELPHALAFFLLPVGVMMGTLSASRPTPAAFTVPRLAVGLMVVVHAGLLVLMFNDYREIEIDHTAYRMRAARIGTLAEIPAPDILILGALQSALVNSRAEPKRGMGAEDLAKMRQTVLRYPSHSGLFRYARASALNGRFDEANWALAVLCRLKSPVECQTAAQNWQVFTADGNPELARVVLPPEMTAASSE
jgi:O-antigen ligase